MAAITNKRQFFKETLKRIIANSEYEIINMLNLSDLPKSQKPIVYPFIGHDAPPELLESGTPYQRMADFGIYIDCGAETDTNKDGKATTRLDEIIDFIELKLINWCDDDTAENISTNKTYSNRNYTIIINGVEFSTTPSPETERNNYRVNALIGGIINYSITMK